MVLAPADPLPRRTRGRAAHSGFQFDRRPRFRKAGKWTFGGNGMDYLWAPWRLSYVAAAKKPGAEDGCFICRGLAEQDDRRNLIALRTPRSVVVLNRFPYNSGHLLVAPRA